MGLGHCWEQGCLMRSIRNIDQLDGLNMIFCDSCSYELNRRIRRMRINSAGTECPPGADLL
jgi:predicted Zn-dependent protease